VSAQIAIRADMDAIPIAEENDFASQNKNVMHACGHDARWELQRYFIILKTEYLFSSLRRKGWEEPLL